MNTSRAKPLTREVAMYQSFEELDVWKRACQVTVSIFELLAECRLFYSENSSVIQGTVWVSWSVTLTPNFSKRFTNRVLSRSRSWARSR